MIAERDDRKRRDVERRARERVRESGIPYRLAWQMEAMRAGLPEAYDVLVVDDDGEIVRPGSGVRTE
jgi:hypothetical protein